MLETSQERILGTLAPKDLMLDVDGWAQPFPRADWVLDLMPYKTRGLYGEAPDASVDNPGLWPEALRDICSREPWPFAENQFDFAIYSHTLEDVRDPVWVCSEPARVARRGYVEVPSRLEEQTFGVQGGWVGWGHHHWFIEITDHGIEFVFKHHIVHGPPSHHFPSGHARTLSAEDRVEQLWWTGLFRASERIFTEPAELHKYLAGFVTEKDRESRKKPQRLFRRRR